MEEVNRAYAVDLDFNRIFEEVFLKMLHKELVHIILSLNLKDYEYIVSSK